ncbi:MAG: type I phosphomannose isomerase catalytic subunit [Planctomycetota bacterium]
MLPPLVFEPILKRIRWGGRKLGTLLGKNIGPELDYAESWELADHADGQSCVTSGPLAGQTLTSLIETHPTELLGRHAHCRQFPLLIKFLDANDWLSLQVHPDDLLARKFNPVENGKTEAWVILDAQPDSRICAGLKADIGPEQLRCALEGGRVEDCLHLIPVKRGDCVFVPAGTVHALGPGIVLAEVQQQSNLTFRLYDWGRVDANGKPRPIHVEESIKCTDFSKGPVDPVRPVQLCDADHSFEELVRCQYFVIRRHRFLDPIRLKSDHRFQILLCLEGQGSVSTSGGTATFRSGSTVLLPASSQDIRLKPQAAVTILEITCP